MNPEFSSEIPVALIDYMGGDEHVIDRARVSTNTVGESTERERFINFLMRDRHGSPFEHCLFTFELDIPIFVARELMRHRIASYSEESGRYTKSRLKFYVPPRQRPLAQTGKPGAYIFKQGTPEQHEAMEASHSITHLQAAREYQRLLHKGIAREVARNVLPVSTYTRIHMTINARSLMNLLSLRNATKDTTVPTFPLWEIQQMAQKMETIFQNLMPITHAAFVTNGRIAP